MSLWTMRLRRVLRLVLAAAAAAAAAAAPAYVLTLRGRAFGTDRSQVRVRVNGVDAPHVVLHNDSAISFVVPDALLEEPGARKSSVVEVTVGGVGVVRGIQLALLADAAKRLDLDRFLSGEEGGGGEVGGYDEVRGEVAAEEEKTRDVDGQQVVQVSEDQMDEGDGRNFNQGDDSGVDGLVGGEGGPAEKTPPSGEQRSAEWRELYGEAAEEEARDAAEAASAEEDLTPEQRETAGWYSQALDILEAGRLEDAADARRILERCIERGDARAKAQLGALLLAGDTPGFERDFDVGVPLVQSASDAGEPRAQAMLGLLHASGMATPAVRKDMGIAVLLWMVAAEGGSSYARTALAYRLHGGVDVPEDCDRGAEYYVAVAREVVVTSRRKARKKAGGSQENAGLAQIRPPTPRAVHMADRKRLTENMEPRAMGESNEIIQYYKHSAERGDTAAQVMIGNLYYYGGANMPQDPERARGLFERAAAGGRMDAHAHLGFMALNSGLNESAIQHLEKAAAAGEKLGLHGMGYASLHGIGLPKDDAKAAVFFSKAAEAEHPEAMYNLGLMHSSGIGVERSMAQAYRYFQDAAVYGHLQSHYNLGLKRLTGTGPGPPDCNSAISKNLKGVAEQGSWNAVLSRALRSYEKGDYGNALFRYVQAAHAGIELAQYNAAFMLEHNTVFNRDAVPELGSVWALLSDFSGPASQDASADSLPKRMGGGTEWTRKLCVAEALDLYQMSSGQGYSRSMVRMGDLAYGEGKDMLRATRAYEKAVRMRNAEASFNLGFMHAAGLVSKPDAFLAKRYFDQAKEFDKAAILPASIAVHALKYHGMFLRFVEKWGHLLGECYRISTFKRSVVRSSSDESLDPDTAFIKEKELLYRYGDLGICVVLFGFLAWIVNARQRRLVRDDRREEDNDVMDAAGLNGVANINAERGGDRGEARN